MPSVDPMILAYMLAQADQLMSDTCTIEVRSDAVGEGGEKLLAYTTVATSVACRVIDAGQTFERSADTVAEREVIVDRYQLITPNGTALAVDQRITLDSDSSVYQIIDLITERTDAVDAQATMVRLQ